MLLSDELEQLRRKYLNLSMTERDFSCDSRDLTLQAALSEGVATVRQNLTGGFRFERNRLAIDSQTSISV
jgi:hypothetical protein